MRINVKIVVGLLVTAAALGFPFLLVSPGGAFDRAAKPAEAHLADARSIQASYAAWRTKHEQAGGDHNILISLGWFKGL